MATQSSLNAVRNTFALLGLDPPSTARLNELARAVDRGQRSLLSIRDDLIQWMANTQGVTFRQALAGAIRGIFERHGVTIGNRNESEQARLNRLADEVMAGRSLTDVDRQIRTFAPATPSTPSGSGGSTREEQPPPQEMPAEEAPEPDPVDFRERVRALMPFLHEELVTVFADAWAETGDRDLALAQMRQNPIYDRHFAGNRRPDGSFRLPEGEYMSTMDAYRTLLSDFQLNPDLFRDRFVDLIEGEVSAGEFRERLGATYEGIVENIPQVREFYASRFGLALSDSAIFAAAIDPNVGEAILNRRIAVAQVGGEGLARGFDVDLSFAERLRDAGVDQSAARGFFSQAEDRLPVFERLAQRHNDPDDTFDLGEFADAAIFGDSEQARRLRRLLDAEASLFSEQLGSFATGGDLAVTGLRQR